MSARGWRPQKLVLVAAEQGQRHARRAPVPPLQPGSPASNWRSSRSNMRASSADVGPQSSTTALIHIASVGRRGPAPCRSPATRLRCRSHRSSKKRIPRACLRSPKKQSSSASIFAQRRSTLAASSGSVGARRCRTANSQRVTVASRTPCARSSEHCSSMRSHCGTYSDTATWCGRPDRAYGLVAGAAVAATGSLAAFCAVALPLRRGAFPRCLGRGAFGPPAAAGDAESAAGSAGSLAGRRGSSRRCASTGSSGSAFRAIRLTVPALSGPSRRRAPRTLVLRGDAAHVARWGGPP
jgi:hypothetical protein